MGIIKQLAIYLIYGCALVLNMFTLKYTNGHAMMTISFMLTFMLLLKGLIEEMGKCK